MLNTKLVIWSNGEANIFRAKSDLDLGDDFSNLNWENVSKDSISNTFTLTDKKEVAYWEAANDGILNIMPSLNVDSWKQIDPNGFSSNVSTQDAANLIRDLINERLLSSESNVFESLDSYAFTQGANPNSHSNDSDLQVSASINANGQLEVTGSTGEAFSASAKYISKYDSNNYFQEQLNSIVFEKAKIMFPTLDYEALNKNQKDSVWEAVKNDKLHWDLTVGDSKTESRSNIDITLSKPWGRLGIYQLGDVVSHDGKLYESVSNENFNHIPTKDGSNFLA